MKLKDLLESTTSGAVAGYVKPTKDAPIKRIGFLPYALDKDCKGCKIIKEHAFKADNSKSELKCAFCGTIHKKGNNV